MLFGEMAIIEGGLRSAGAKAVGSVLVKEIDSSKSRIIFNNNVISGGLFNFIGGGQSNEIGDESGGTTGCQYGVILGGTKNYINVVVSSAQDGPAIIGGRSNIVNHDGAVIIGMNGKTSTATNTVYVQNLDVAGNILGPITIDGNLTVNGEATYISSSTIVTSGSNIFGDDSSDTHIFNGKITASGNVDGGDYVIKIHNSNNDAGTDKGAGIEFAHNFVGSATVKPAGKFVHSFQMCRKHVVPDVSLT